MDKNIISSASFYNQNYYFNANYGNLPEEEKKKLKTITVIMAENIKGVFSVGFYTDGTVFLETKGMTDDFDEEYAKNEIENFRKENMEFLNSLKLWYIIFYTEKGDAIIEGIDLLDGFGN